MESIQIKTNSQKTLCINDDEARWISFDTEDFNFYARLNGLYQSLGAKQQELVKSEKDIKALDSNDEFGAPLAGLAMIDLQADFAKSVTDGMDSVFGAGTCERLFGGVFTPAAYGELIKGILSRVSQDREKKLNNALKKKPGKKVMS